MTESLPEVNFLTTSPQELTNELVQFYEEVEGRKLAQADPLYLIFLTVASVISKQNVKLDDAAKQNLLYYSRNGVLDHKGDELRTPRLKAKAAKTTLRIYFSVPATESRIIQAGILATSEKASIFFITKQAYTIPIGAEYIDVELECTLEGVIGNGFMPGQINSLVSQSQLPYVSRVENITTSDGGSEIEEDTPYKERIRLAPESFTNAGSEGAYAYFAKSASSLISDVHVHMPSEGRVNIAVLLQGGDLPSQEILDLVYEKCGPKTVRPLTDHLTVSQAETISYDLTMQYFIDENVVNKEVVQNKILQAVEDYIVWQQSKFGRDINPSQLIADCFQAGAKRVNVLSPSYTEIGKGQVARINEKNVTFGGVIDDD